jgi:hypothetical protein
MSAGGGVTDGSETAVYKTVDEKVELLLERMNAMVVFIRAYKRWKRRRSKPADPEWDEYEEIFESTPNHRENKPRQINQKPEADVIELEMMNEWYSRCIDSLQERQNELKKNPSDEHLKYLRDNSIDITCTTIGTLDEYSIGKSKSPEFKHIRNEMQNLMIIKDDLSPVSNKNGVITVNAVPGALMKSIHAGTKDVVVFAEDNGNKKCLICMVTARDTVLYPCTHLCLCGTCSVKVDRCPYCRADIDTKMHVSDAISAKKTILVCAHLPGWEDHTSRLLHELQALSEI